MTREIDASTSQLAPLNGDIVQAAPSIETILLHAIEQRIDPAALEKLVALQERVESRRAEQAFNDAVSKFKKICPPIGANRAARDHERGNRVMYRYADLQFIQSIIDPILADLGLSYTFDMTVGEHNITTTCFVRHIDGHIRSQSFTCPACGTKIMNDAQRAASATSYGCRYALRFAFGLRIEADDDGALIPNPKPEADPAAPVVAPRAERQPPAAPADPNAVKGAEIVALMRRWAEWAMKPTDADPQAIKVEFVAWAMKNLRTSDDLSQARNWTNERLIVAGECMQ